MTPGPPRRHWVVYPYLPHYRAAVFDELTSRLEHVGFAYGRSTPEHNRMRLIEPPSQAEARVPLRNRWHGSWLWQSGLWRVLKARPSSVIVLGDPHYLSNWLLALVLRSTGRTRVYFWTIGWHRPERRRLPRLVRNLYFRLAHHLFVYGPHGAGFGVAAGFPRQRMTVVYNGFGEVCRTDDPPRPLPLPSLPQGCRLVGAVLRLHPNKGLDLLIAAAARLRSSGVDVGVALAGDGPESARLVQAADRCGVPLFLLGEIYDEERLAAFYAAIEVTVIPEEAGLTAIQSLTHGVPVVTNDAWEHQMPEAAAVVEGVNGGFFRRGEADDLATVIGAWLDRLDRGAEGVDDACRRSITDWTAQSTARRIAERVLAET